MHNAARGAAFLLNLSAAGARKQLLSCRHWQGERPQMYFNSKPHSPTELLITQGLDPRLMVDPRVGKSVNGFLQFMCIARPRPDVSKQLWFSNVDGWRHLFHVPTGKSVS